MPKSSRSSQPRFRRQEALVCELLSNEAVIPRFTFTIRSVMFVTACTAAFMAARRSFVFNHHDGLNTTLARAYCLPPLFAVVVALFYFIEWRNRYSNALIRVVWAGIIGCTAGLVVTIILGVEIAEGFRNQYPEYWIWTQDWDVFAFVLVRESLICLLAGTMAAAVGWGIESAVKRVVRRPAGDTSTDVN